MKMTLHRALSELKLIDSKITNAMLELNPTGIYQKGKKVNNYYDKEEFEKAARSKMDSINALIERKKEIKTKLVAANAVALVTVGGKTMSIADAITYKSQVGLKKLLLDKLRSHHNKTQAEFNKVNEKVQANVQGLLEATLGGKEGVSKAPGETVRAIQASYMENNEILMSDPLKIEVLIESLGKEISEFESEVDAVLSEANAINFIMIGSDEKSNLPLEEKF